MKLQSNRVVQRIPPGSGTGGGCHPQNSVVVYNSAARSAPIPREVGIVDVWTDLEIEAAALSHAAKVAALPTCDQGEAVGRWLRFVIDAGLKGPALGAYQRCLTGRVYELRQVRREAETSGRRA